MRLAIAYVLPVVVLLWHLSPQQAGILISGGFFGQLFGALFFGWFAQRFGRLKSLMGSIAIFGALSLACAFSWSYLSLLLCRAPKGSGLGGEVPVAATYIGELAPARSRGRFVLLFELVFPSGILAASVLGVWLVPNLGWQAIFARRRSPLLLVFCPAAAAAGEPALACRQRPSRRGRNGHSRRRNRHRTRA